jgi:hypothetical protein
MTLALTSGSWGIGLEQLLRSSLSLIANKNKEFWIEWGSTAILIVGVCLTSFNIFPANIYFSLLGNAGWAIMAVMWKKWSLLVIQVVLSIIYLIGLIAHYRV